MRKFDPSLLHKYLRNQCTDKEISEVLDWLDTAEGQKRYAETIDAGIAQIDGKTQFLLNHKIDSRKILNDIYKTAEAKSNKQSKNPYKFSFGRYFSDGHKIAAVLGGLILLTVAYFLTFQFNSTTTHVTAYGETKTIVLPDNSKVVLNASSELSYDPPWNSETDREVWIKGEAFFSVEHKGNDQKFLVHAQNLNIEVLGTKFNVNNRRGSTKVVLSTGKVKLKIDHAKQPREVLMKPGELVEFSKKDNKFIKKTIDPEIYTSWRNKKLIFNKTPVKEIAMLLEDNYGYKVIIEDAKLAGMTITGTIPLDSRNSDVLIRVLSESFNLNIKKKDGLLIIFKKE